VSWDEYLPRPSLASMIKQEASGESMAIFPSFVLCGVCENKLLTPEWVQMAP